MIFLIQLSLFLYLIGILIVSLLVLLNYDELSLLIGSEEKMLNDMFITAILWPLFIYNLLR